MQTDLLPAKTGRLAFLSAGFVLKPERLDASCSQEPVKNFFFVCYSLVGLANEKLC